MIQVWTISAARANGGGCDGARAWMRSRARVCVGARQWVCACQCDVCACASLCVCRCTLTSVLSKGNACDHACTHTHLPMFLYMPVPESAPLSVPMLAVCQFILTSMSLSICLCPRPRHVCVHVHGCVHGVYVGARAPMSCLALSTLHVTTSPAPCPLPSAAGRLSSALP